MMMFAFDVLMCHIVQKKNIKKNKGLKAVLYFFIFFFCMLLMMFVILFKKRI